ncbi:MAG: Ku protein [Alphaproteobacteria bacterium]|nr:Ku protein [Alphaproteobacteria bacterium]
MAARPSWQGHLKLSLVTCPVSLYNAVSPRGEVHFNLLNPKTGNRIRMVTIDAGTEEPLDRKELVKGFEIAKGEYVQVTQEEIDSVRLESTRTIEIESFVPAEEIDRLYWDNPYYLVPDGKMAAEPFTVIREAMERAGQVALGRLVMSQRERLVALEPRDNGIVATTLRSYQEVRDMAQFFDDIPNVKPDRDMIAIAEKIIAQKEEDFDPTQFDDRYEDALKALIEEKRKGHKVVRPKEAEPSNVINLMDALKKSLSSDSGKKSAGRGKQGATSRPGKKPAKRKTSG